MKSSLALLVLFAASIANAAPYLDCKAAHRATNPGAIKQVDMKLSLDSTESDRLRTEVFVGKLQIANVFYDVTAIDRSNGNVDFTLRIQDAKNNQMVQSMGYKRAYVGLGGINTLKSHYHTLSCTSVEPRN